MRLNRFSRNVIFGSVAVAALLASSLLSACSTSSSAKTTGTTATNSATGKTTLVLYGAGTLSVPFNKVITAFEQANPNITVQPQFGGSVKMAKQITQLHEPADILAVADYHVIPQQLYSNNGSAADADWYIGFVSNAITLVYTDKSKGASDITNDNWYNVVAESGVQIGRSNPDTDPSGYQFLQMLKLASQYYNAPSLYDDVMKNAPQTDIRDTETDLISALEAGQIDYLAIYQSDAMQHGFKYLKLPPQINLSDASYASDYAKASVQTANGDLTASPIIYGITIPKDAPHPQAAQAFVKFLLGSQGQSFMQQSGFGVINPPIASGMQNVPSDIQSLVKAWPGGS